MSVSQQTIEVTETESLKVIGDSATLSNWHETIQIHAPEPNGLATPSTGEARRVSDRSRFHHVVHVLEFLCSFPALAPEWTVWSYYSEYVTITLAFQGNQWGGRPLENSVQHNLRGAWTFARVTRTTTTTRRAATASRATAGVGWGSHPFADVKHVLIFLQPPSSLSADGVHEILLKRDLQIAFNLYAN